MPPLRGQRNFYPRPPRGGRPDSRNTLQLSPLISIHALREEGDLSQPLPRSWPSYFYPRPPRGGRLQLFQPRHGDLGFLSTPSARRATRMTIQYETGTLFLSTPSARRATRRSLPDWPWPTYFYPRPPRGGRPQESAPAPSSSNFYPRPPRGGRLGCC